MTTPIVSPEIPQLKRCHKCGEIKPRDAFYRCARNSDGLQHRCKVCCAEYAHNWNIENKDAIRERNRQYRADNADAIKARGQKYYQENSRDINARHRQRYHDNPEPTARRGKKWKEANGEHFKEYQRQYYVEHVNTISERNKQHYQDNAPRIRERQKAYHKTANGQASYRVRKHRRRAREANAAGSFSWSDIELIRKAQGDCCYLCGKKLTAYHVDHFIPLSKGGTNDPGNLRLACPKCNLSKHDKHPFELGRLL